MKTTSQDALNQIIDHLLGKHWYIVDPVGGDQARELIVDEIKRQYSARDESPVDKWRRKHKRCAWCIHCKSECVFDPNSQMFETKYTCYAKRLKYIDIDIPRPFCSIFNLKKEN